MLKEQLDKIMRPKAIAVVGASTKDHTIGSDIMKRLKEYKFTGDIYPVNPKGGEIEGFKAYTNVKEIPGNVDLAIIVIAQKFVLQAIEDCHEKGIKASASSPQALKKPAQKALQLKKNSLQNSKNTA